MKYHITAVSDKDLKNYPKALTKELQKIKKAKLSLTVYSWIKEKIGTGDIRLKEGFVPLEEGNYVISNEKYKGISPRDAYISWSSEKEPDHKPICLLQYLHLIQEYPDFLEEVLYLDFCADEVRYDSSFSSCPSVLRNDSSAFLVSYDADSANADYGSFVASWESKIDLGKIEPSEPLFFDPGTLEVVINGITFIPKP